MEKEIPEQALFKWIGGKKWLANEIKNTLDTIELSEKTTYIEPFVGGLGSFRTIYEKLKKHNVKNIVLNDINQEIIKTYKLIKTNPEDIISRYNVIEEDYEKTITNKEVHKLKKTKQKEEVKKGLIAANLFFKEKRKEFNVLKLKKTNKIEEDLQLVSLFLFLQDHSFNGVYRENMKGEYNTPFNWDPKKYNVSIKTNLIKEYSTFFNSKNIDFRNEDVFKLLEEYKEKSNEVFIYLDPPYLNEGETQENKYNKDHFGLKEQKQLLNVLRDFDTLMYSNHYSKLFTEYFSNKNHSFKEVMRRNIMTSKVEDRNKKVSEILATKTKTLKTT